MKESGKMLIESNSEILTNIFKRYEQINGKKILESLKKLEFKDDEERFSTACLIKVVKHLEKKKDEMSDEEFLALLIRLVMMYFVREKRYSDLWYLFLLRWLSKEFRINKKSEIVKRLEEQFIEYMEEVAQEHGDKAMKDTVLMFLFKENAEFTLPVLETIEMLQTIGACLENSIQDMFRELNQKEGKPWT